MTAFAVLLGVAASAAMSARISPLKPDVPTVMLTQGVLAPIEMPAVGLGSFGYGRCDNATGVNNTCHGGEVFNNTMIVPIVKEWIRLGGRRIDGALSYLTQVGMGQGIKEAIEEKLVTREELFVTSKTDMAPVPPDAPRRLINDTGFEYTLWQFEQILNTTKLDYIDLLLIHWPGVARTPPQETSMACAEGHPLAGNAKGFSLCRKNMWKAFNYLLESKKVRAIGVSNFEVNHLEDTMTPTRPAVNQMEYHPFYFEPELAQHCNSLEIRMQSYSPLGAYDHMTCGSMGCRDWEISPLEHPVIISVAEKHRITPAQAILKWAWQSHQVSNNPRTKSSAHMMENLESLTGVTLDASDIATINGIRGVAPAPDIWCGAPPMCDDKTCPEPKFIP